MLVVITRGTVADGRCVGEGALEDLSVGAAKELLLLGKARLPLERELPAVTTGGGAGIDEAPQAAAPVEAVALALGPDRDEAEGDIAAEAPDEAPVRRKRGRPRKY